MNRRDFLRGFGALAALAAVPSLASIPAADSWAYTTTPVQLPNAPRVVFENETFYLKRGLVLENMPFLYIRNCRFVIDADFTGPMLTLGQGCHGARIESCMFESRTT